jgi:hypothetical protein
MRQLIAASVIVILAACGPNTPASPSPPTPPPTPPAGMSFSIEGRVFDTARRGVADTRVEITDSLNAGAVTITDAKGDFTFGGLRLDAPNTIPNTTLRASKEGYLPTEKQILNYLYSPHPIVRTILYLASSKPSVDLAGQYVVTITADPACTMLPLAARTRTYQATVVPSPPSPTGLSSNFKGTLTGAMFREKSYTGGGALVDRITGLDVATFEDVATLFFYDPSEEQGFLTEQIGPDTYLVVDVVASGAITGSVIDLPASGGFQYCERPTNGTSVTKCEVGPLTCYPGNHRVTLTRR